ncbi:hypothetical protein ANCDUO_02082 [Ancylostoma duodenale]|uniref:Uncharacterized protein n=1 Tax=Ancylostoma duodenale TaxID=51022 RepID=A0A0C2HDG5_9BILA|nr:hypothetical protein ANCDUO_02082 [Ancylostoma duodenale]
MDSDEKSLSWLDYAIFAASLSLSIGTGVYHAIRQSFERWCKFRAAVVSITYDDNQRKHYSDRNSCRWESQFLKQSLLPEAWETLREKLSAA